MKSIIIATIKDWNLLNFKEFSEVHGKQYNIILISKKEELTLEYLQSINPAYIFFPHWSWKIEKEIFENFDCVVFHETDLPFGRGGSPIQNLIRRGIKSTKISALKVNEIMDGGDIYLKRDLDLSKGNAQQIFERASLVIFNKMIPYILNNEPIAEPQVGEVVEFKRRKPSQSEIIREDLNTIEEVNDFIRMLDAQGYPKAFIQLGKFKIELSGIETKDNKFIGKFEVIDE